MDDFDNYDDDFATVKRPPVRSVSKRSLAEWKNDDFDFGGNSSAGMGTLKVENVEEWDAALDKDATVRGRPRQFESNRLDLSAGAVPLMSAPLPMVIDDDDFEDDFDALPTTQMSPTKEGTIRAPKPAENLDRDFPSSFSDSSARMSISSSLSASSMSSIPTADDDDFDFEEPQTPRKKGTTGLDLARRYKEQKLKLEREAEETERQARRAAAAKKPSALAVRFQGFEDGGDDIGGLDIDALRLSSHATLNKNVKIGAQSSQIPAWLKPVLSDLPPPHTPQSSRQHSHQQSGRIRSSRSIAHIPSAAQAQAHNDAQTFNRMKHELAPDSQKLLGARLRASQSMADIGGRDMSSSRHRTRPSTTTITTNAMRRSQSRAAMLAPQPEQPQPQIPREVRQRPLTYYKEPAEPVTHAHRSRSKAKGPSLIRNTASTLTRQERNGMVLNPTTRMWEGNDIDAAKFDTSAALDPPTADLGSVRRPKLIQPQPSLTRMSVATESGMIFDSANMCWVYPETDTYEDPFADLEELRPTRSVTGLSTTSFSSSIGVGRLEHSGAEVFDVPPETRVLWKREDERIMRKFGRWIGGEKEKADLFTEANCLYRMFRAS